ncbi:MAG: OsmC family protein [Burkholderiaceae bacterium]|nr:OsmC family protein [Burkholderiaceae bacterium]
MHQYYATISWNRGEQRFTDNRYSRAHEWQFDGGAVVPASSSELNVPLPMSVAANVDPEEALVASASSCHMLFFLSYAATRGFLVDSYRDAAYGVMEKNGEGKIAFTRIVLRPQIVFGGERQPGAEELETLHHESHASCFIANSLKADVIVEPA